MTVAPAKPAPHTKDCRPKGAPQSVESTYAYAAAAIVGAPAASTAPTDVEFEPPPLVGSARRSVEAAAPSGAATAESAPPVPAVVAEPSTPV